MKPEIAEEVYEAILQYYHTLLLCKQKPVIEMRPVDSDELPDPGGPTVKWFYSDKMGALE